MGLNFTRGVAPWTLGFHPFIRHKHKSKVKYFDIVIRPDCAQDVYLYSNAKLIVEDLHGMPCSIRGSLKLNMQTNNLQCVIARACVRASPCDIGPTSRIGMGLITTINCCYPVNVRSRQTKWL